MGASASITAFDKAVGKECVTFVEAFEGLCPKTNSAKANRIQGWRSLDLNGNGFVSLAETGKWIRETLIAYTENAIYGEMLYKCFYPSYIRAFKDAADAGRDTAIAGSSASADDYVQKNEFRLLCSYLCLYAIMFDHFAKIDGGGSNNKGADGEGVEGSDDDRRISREEWHKARTLFKRSPFVSLKVASRSTKKNVADSIFDEMDADKKGMVLLKEFCDWIKEGEMELGTDYGKILGIDVK